MKITYYQLSVWFRMKSSHTFFSEIYLNFCKHYFFFRNMQQFPFNFYFHFRSLLSKLISKSPCPSNHHVEIIPTQQDSYRTFYQSYTRATMNYLYASFAVLVMLCMKTGIQENFFSGYPIVHFCMQLMLWIFRCHTTM